jgi:hypothetical protein
MSDSASTLLYVYGVVRPGFDLARAPAGLDDHPLELVPAGDAAALASYLPREKYSPEIIEQRSGDMEWVSPRAVAHDRVLTWAQERGGIVPMPMFSLWADPDALAHSLAARADELRRTFERVRDADEYGLRVHRRDQDVLAAIHEMDPDLAALRRQAEAAAPGQRYLLERKIAEQSRQAVRAAGQRMAREVFDSLRQKAREAVTRPLTPAAAAPDNATLVLNAAFLVDRVRLDAFREQLAQHVRTMEPRGMTFDFTGPWAPYNFVA